MNFATRRVDYGYLKVLIVGKAISVKVFCEDAQCAIASALALNSIPILSLNGTPFCHTEEKYLHSGQPWFVLFASQFLFLNNTRSDAAICRR
jgi:hypothetical protein